MARRPMSPKQRAALRKAQLASARKRKGTGKGRPTAKRRGMSTGKKLAIGGAAVAVGVGIAYGANYAGKKYAADVKRKGAQRAKQRANSNRITSKDRTPVSNAKATPKRKSSPPGQTRAQKNATADRRQATRERQLGKARDRAEYESGMSGGRIGAKKSIALGTRKAAPSAKKTVSPSKRPSLLPKTSWDGIHPNVQRKILRNNRRNSR